MPNRDDLYAAYRRSIVTTPNTRINPAVVDVPGSDVNLVGGGASLMGEEVVAAFSRVLRGLFVQTAKDDQLDRVAFDRYGLTRFPSTAATVDLTLSRAAPGLAFTYAAGSRVQTPNGVQFATDVDLVIPAGAFSLSVSATALLVGVDANTSAGTITQFVDAPADSTIQLTNPVGAAGGTDAETDTQFRGRIFDFFPTVRRGTLGAIEFGARQVPGIVVAKAIEIENLCDGEPLPACEVQLTVADANGNSSSALIRRVQEQLIFYRAAGIPVQVQGGTIVPVLVQWHLNFAAGIDIARAKQEVVAVTVATAQFLKPGETLFASTLISAVRTVNGVIVFDNRNIPGGTSSLVLPSGDVVPTANNILLRISAGDVSFVTA